ncbi:MAG: DUF815 domain-containing protein, partial [Alphaproteobacteria bacterium]|nr:DUF815 domain-containing protein [Alphaproteobacteria bacterium]
MFDETVTSLLSRIAEALERAYPPLPLRMNLQQADAFVWDARSEALLPVEKVSAIPLSWLMGIDHARDTLLANTLQFAQGLPANNALLWGARGMGKSSLVKAVHGEVNRRRPHALAMV